MTKSPYGSCGPDYQPCPWCKTPCICDAVDVGVGFVQCGPYHCEQCGASEIGPHDEPRDLTAEEADKGWYAPDSEPSSSANVIGGKIVSHTEMRDAYRAEFTGNPDWEDKAKVDDWYRRMRQP